MVELKGTDTDLALVSGVRSGDESAMASYTRKFVAAGVNLVGGCCGTTPEHIREMKSALRVGGARAKTAEAGVKKSDALVATPSVPLDQRSRLGKKIAAGEFATMRVRTASPPKRKNIFRPEDFTALAKSTSSSKLLATAACPPTAS